MPREHVWRTILVTSCGNDYSWVEGFNTAGDLLPSAYISAGSQTSVSTSYVCRRRGGGRQYRQTSLLTAINGASNIWYQRLQPVSALPINCIADVNCLERGITSLYI